MIKSTIEHERSKMGCFARVQFLKRMMNDYYSGALMYMILYDNKTLDKIHEQREMSAGLQELQTSDVLMSERMINDYCSGALMYMILYDCKALNRIHGQRVVSAGLKELQTSNVLKRDYVRNIDVRIHRT